VPVHPSAELNFALPRKFSVSVSLIVTMVVFGDLISNIPHDIDPISWIISEKWSEIQASASWSALAFSLSSPTSFIGH
jgi:hypothetical protein